MNLERQLRMEAEEKDVTNNFQIVLNVIKRNCKSAHSGVGKGTLIINCDTIDQFKEVIWDFVKPPKVIQRQVDVTNVDDNIICTWSNAEVTIDSLENFILFVDDAKKKKTFTLSKVKDQVIQKWQRDNMKVTIYVSAYSHEVSNTEIYAAVKKQLIELANPDRAGC